MGNKKETDEAFENAETIVDLELINNRIIPNSMEPSGLYLHLMQIQINMRFTVHHREYIV